MIDDKSHTILMIVYFFIRFNSVEFLFCQNDIPLIMISTVMNLFAHEAKMLAMWFINWAIENLFFSKITV